MANVLLAALKMTLGIIVNKTRSSLAEHLKHGGINSRQLRDILLDKFEKISEKLDAHSRCELLACISFIKDGMHMLENAIEEKNRLDEKKDRWCEILRNTEASTIAAGSITWNDWFQKLVLENAFGHIVDMINRLTRNEDVKEWKFPPYLVNYYDNRTEELKKEVKNLQSSHLSHKYHSAMKKFDDVYYNATVAFNDASLSLEDRIMAASFRIHSGLVLSLKDPGLLKLCKSYLTDLLNLPEIGEIFKVDRQGGVRAMFNSVKRHEIVQTIFTISFALFQYLSRFTHDSMNVCKWSLIQTSTWTYNTLIPDEEIIGELMRAELAVPSLLPLEAIKTEKMTNLDPKLTAINKLGEIFWFQQRTDTDDSKKDVCELLKISKTMVQRFYTFPTFTVVSFLTVSTNDNLIVFADVVDDTLSPGHCMYDVYIFDMNGSILEVYEKFIMTDNSVALVPTPADVDIAILIAKKNYVFLPGALTKFRDSEIKSLVLEAEIVAPTLATIDHELNVITVKKYGCFAQVFHQHGNIVKEFTLFNKEKEACVAIAFNNTEKELITISCIENEYFLSTYDLDYPESRKHHFYLAHLSGTSHQDIHITSHVAGPIALISKKYVIHIQRQETENDNLN